MPAASLFSCMVCHQSSRFRNKIIHCFLREVSFQDFIHCPDGGFRIYTYIRKLFLCKSDTGMNGSLIQQCSQVRVLQVHDNSTYFIRRPKSSQLMYSAMQDLRTPFFIAATEIVPAHVIFIKMGIVMVIAGVVSQLFIQRIGHFIQQILKIINCKPSLLIHGFFNQKLPDMRISDFQNDINDFITGAHILQTGNFASDDVIGSIRILIIKFFPQHTVSTPVLYRMSSLYRFFLSNKHPLFFTIGKNRSDRILWQANIVDWAVFIQKYIEALIGGREKPPVFIERKQGPLAD